MHHFLAGEWQEGDQTVFHFGLRARGARDVRLLSIVAAPEGVRLLAERAPGVHVFATALDRGLNDRKYILPGLGDFGDRLYGT